MQICNTGVEYERLQVRREADLFWWRRARCGPSQLNSAVSPAALLWQMRSALRTEEPRRKYIRRHSSEGPLFKRELPWTIAFHLNDHCGT